MTLWWAIIINSLYSYYSTNDNNIHDISINHNSNYFDKILITH